MAINFIVQKEVFVMADYKISYIGDSRIGNAHLKRKKAAKVIAMAIAEFAKDYERMCYKWQEQ